MINLVPGKAIECVNHDSRDLFLVLLAVGKHGLKLRTAFGSLCARRLCKDLQDVKALAFAQSFTLPLLRLDAEVVSLIFRAHPTIQNGTGLLTCVSATRNRVASQRRKALGYHCFAPIFIVISFKQPTTSPGG